MSDIFNEITEEKEADYTQFKNGADLLNALNDNGYKWALAFTQTIKKVAGIELDVNAVFPWFANAIEWSNQYRINEALKKKEEEHNGDWGKDNS